MNSHGQLTSPLDVWAAASLAAVTASMEIAAGAASAAAALYGNALKLPGSTQLAPPAPASRDTFVRSSEADPAGTDSHRRSSTARSWYRPPYRSPFDPLFWMTPGHPMDHASDWLSAFGRASAVSTEQSLGRMWAGSLTGQSSRQERWAAEMWAVWLDMIAAPTRGLAQMNAVAGNIVDIGSAFATYRTPGGHATAQVTRTHPMPSRATDPVQAALRGDVTAALPWMLPFGLAPWLRH